MKPLLYGPDGKPLPPKEENRNPARKESTKRTSTGTATVAAGRPWKTFTSVILGFATLLGIVVLYPRTSIAPEDILFKSSDPFSVRLRVENNGTFAIYDTTMDCYIDFFHLKGREIIIGSSRGHEATDLPIGELAGGGYSETACPIGDLMRQGEQAEAGMRVLLNFRPRFWPVHIRRIYFLKGYTTPDGQMHWIRVSKY